MSTCPIFSVVADNGLPLRSVDNGDGTATRGGAAVLQTYPSAARTTVVSDSFNTAGISFIAIDLTVTAFAGGSSPSIQFNIDRQGADGLWYLVWSSASITGSGLPSVVTMDLGPGFASVGLPNGSQHAVFTNVARFRSVMTGTPTSVTWSASVIGR